MGERGEEREDGVEERGVKRERGDGKREGRRKERKR